MQEGTFIFAFIAGFVSFLAPCVLPLIPGFLSYLAGISLQDTEQQKRRKIFILESRYSDRYMEPLPVTGSFIYGSCKIY